MVACSMLALRRVDDDRDAPQPPWGHPLSAARSEGGGTTRSSPRWPPESLSIKIPARSQMVDATADALVPAVEAGFGLATDAFDFDRVGTAKADAI